MTIVDWVFVAALVVFAVAGWRRGFVAGVLSFAGFLGGGLLGAFVLPPLVATTGLPDLARALAVAGGVLVLALLGQFAASILGSMLRGALSWQPVRIVDNVGGAALNVLALAVVAWIVASAIAYLPASSLTEQFTGSRVLVALDSIVPSQVRNAFGSLRDLVSSSAVPRVFSGFAQITGPDVAEPDPTVDSAAVAQARDSVVRVTNAGCLVEGSGFVVAPGVVLTNAHVVAGSDDPLVRVRAADMPLPASVRYFDPSTDVALLVVPGLNAPALQFASEQADSGQSAVIVGFPLSGPFAAEPARVRTTVQARGDDIYGRAGVDREVYVIRGDVRPGNSGGPLLDVDGRVLGMVFGSDPQNDRTGYAITAGQLDRAIPAGDVTAGAAGDGAADTGACVTPS